ncbi:MAG TPA: L,D-transpeptidase family protein [Verrucomicrobiae bacterium]|nr:L,D-transpeptidase family protein [Verrucomicrobiae bacterium]
MARRAKPKNQPPRHQDGGLGRLFFIIVLGCGFYFFWRHDHSQKAQAREPDTNVNLPAEALVPRSRPAPQPLVISQQAPSDFPRPVHDVFEAQVALARRAISPGSIDGNLGSQTRAAISVFQETENLPVTGALDDLTKSNLTLTVPILTSYTVTTNDLGSLQPLGDTWLAKSEQSSLAYETELELLAEKSHSSPTLIQKLNRNVDWSNISAGTVVQIPDVTYPDPDGKAAFVVIHLSDRYLEAFDNDTNLLLHFPCSIAQKVEKRPVGELHVVVVIQHPNYTVDPELFPESDELQKIGHKLILPPGPKNPVGMAWMGLDRPGYGMHGTPNAQLVGRTESHGCFRLANWDALYLSQLVWVGMPVEVEE